MSSLRDTSRGALAAAAALALAACGFLAPTPSPPPPHPAAAPPPYGADGAAEWRAAIKARGPRIVVSLRDRVLWLLDASGDTLITAPVAVGKDQVFNFRGNTYRFQTPRGQRRIVAKKTDPIWVPPEWHYYEKAARRGLEPVKIEPGKRYLLSDATVITMRDGKVGRINRFGNFWPFTPGTEIIFDDKIFIPPLNSPQREIPNALGTHALDLGDGYLIHGTHVYNRDSIGRAASHGCIRMRNQDIAQLFELVQVGTPVYIY